MTTAAESTGAQAALITRHVIREHAEFTGRGPNSGRTHMSRDCITVVLEGVLSKGERNLIDSDRPEPVEANQDAFQDALRESLINGVELVTGRKVRTMLSANDVEHDIATEVFVLEPLDRDAAAARDAEADPEADAEPDAEAGLAST